MTQFRTEEHTIDLPGMPGIIVPKKVPKGWRVKQEGEVFEVGDREGYASRDDLELLEDWMTRVISPQSNYSILIGDKVPPLCVLTPLEDEPEASQEAPQSIETENEGDALARFFMASPGTWEGFGGSKGE